MHYDIFTQIKNAMDVQQTSQYHSLEMTTVYTGFVQIHKHIVVQDLVTFFNALISHTWKYIISIILMT